MEELLLDGLRSWGRYWSAAPARTFAWSITEVLERRNRLLFDTDTYAGTGLPDSLAWLSASRESGAPGMTRLFDELEQVIAPLSLLDVELSVYDFGMSTILLRAGWRDQPRAERLILSSTDALATVERWSSEICSVVALQRWFVTRWTTSTLGSRAGPSARTCGGARTASGILHRTGRSSGSTAYPSFARLLAAPRYRGRWRSSSRSVTTSASATSVARTGC